MISRRVAQAAVMGRLSYCLMAGALFSGSCSLLAQNTAFGNHEGFPGASIHRQICSVTADCANVVPEPVRLGAHPSVSAASLSARRMRQRWSWMTQAPAPEREIRSISTRRTVPGRRCGPRTIPACRRPVFITSPRLVRFASPRREAPAARQWCWMRAPALPNRPGIRYLIGKFYEFQSADSTNLCLTASGKAVGSAVVLDTCTGSSSQLWSLAVETNSSNTGKGGLAASPCNGIGDMTIGGVSYKPTWCQEFEGPGTSAIHRGLEFRSRKQ